MKRFYRISGKQKERIVSTLDSWQYFENLERVGGGRYSTERGEIMFTQTDGMEEGGIWGMRLMRLRSDSLFKKLEDLSGSNKTEDEKVRIAVNYQREKENADLDCLLDKIQCLARLNIESGE